MHVNATTASSSPAIANTPSIAGRISRSERLLPATTDHYDGDGENRLAVRPDRQGNESQGSDGRWLKRVGEGDQGEGNGRDKKSTTQTLTATILQAYHPPPPPEEDEQTNLSSNRTSVVVVSWASHDSRIQNHEASSAAHPTKVERSRERGEGWALFGNDHFDATGASDVRSHLLDNEPAEQRAC